jgi:hypothetical protein
VVEISAFTGRFGKVERWHQTLRTEFLDQAGPFAMIEEAQAAWILGATNTTMTGRISRWAWPPPLPGPARDHQTRTIR